MESVPFLNRMGVEPLFTVKDWQRFTLITGGIRPRLKSVVMEHYVIGPFRICRQVQGSVVQELEDEIT